MTAVSRHKYLVLLAALLGAMIVYPSLHDRVGSPLALNLVRTGLFLAAVWVGFADHPLRAAAVVLAVPAVVGAWTGYALPGLPEAGVALGFHLSAALFQAFVAVVLVRAVYRDPAVTVDTIGGALCGYMLTGVAFGHIYAAGEAVAPGSFAGLGGAAGERIHFRLTYFSFITLTTVGYGDVTPLADTARSLAAFEAVVGQFYMAVLIAGLIAKGVGPPPPAAGPASSTAP